MSARINKVNTLFSSRAFFKNVRLKNAQIRTYPRLRKSEKLLFWILHKIMEIICFSANVRQCNIASSVVHVQLCFKSFFATVLFSCRPGKQIFNRAYLCFRLVNVVGTIEAEILKYLRTFSLNPKSRRSYKKSIYFIFMKDLANSCLTSVFFLTDPPLPYLNLKVNLTSTLAQTLT